MDKNCILSYTLAMENKFDLKKAVLFDMDGTLLDTLTDLRIAVNEGLKTEGYPLRTQEEVRLFVGNGMKKLLERALPEGKPLGRVGEVFHAYYAKHGTDNTRPYEGIAELLAELKKRGVPMGVVSNKAEAALRLLVEKIFPDTFLAVVGQREDLPVKPHPAMAFAAMQAMKVQPEDCLFVGDSDVDFKTGQNANIFTVCALWGFRTEEELKAAGATEFAATPKELLSYVK